MHSRSSRKKDGRNDNPPPEDHRQTQQEAASKLGGAMAHPGRGTLQARRERHQQEAARARRFAVVCLGRGGGNLDLGYGRQIKRET